MPKLGNDYETAQESTAGSGGFKRMTPGVYTCRIMAVDTEWETRNGTQRAEERQCVRLRLDVAEGEFEGEFSRDFYVGKPYAHSLFMSWSERALGLLKHSFKALDEANPGFDSRAAFEADQWMMFINKRVRVLWNGQERTNARGYVDVYVRPERMLTAEEAPEPEVELERGAKVDWSDYSAARGAEPAGGQASTSAYDSSEVPF